MIDLLKMHNQMKPNTISLTFKGSVTFDLIDSMIMIVTNRLEQIEGDIRTRKKVFGVLLECLQNLCHYVEKFKKSEEETHFDPSSAIFMIDSDENGYNVATANFIRTDKVEKLKVWIDKINSLSKDELKVFYKEVLGNKTYSEKGGGNLGFIDIARKIDGELDYSFETIDDEFSFFSFEIQIKKVSI